jgi:hypothetical protein
MRSGAAKFAIAWLKALAGGAPGFVSALGDKSTAYGHSEVPWAEPELF